MIRRPPRSTPLYSSAASDVYKRQEGLDIVFVENVGNLVCPASYDVGTHINVVLLSVPEGDDKPAKYPVMFRVVDVLLITKYDLLPYVDFDVEKAIREARKLNPKVDIIE